MLDKEKQQANEQTRKAWNTNAAFWDERMAEGNSWFQKLIWHATERLLEIKPGEVVLDIACGNGLTSRRMAVSGAKVSAFDFAEEMIAHARQRTTINKEKIEYLVLDATDEKVLLSLGKGRFDAALCNMALFDMADINPLMHALAVLLKPAGRFVFSIVHPCFNNPYTTHVGEMTETDGQVKHVYSIKITKYITASMARGLAMVGQPEPQIYFHRPLQDMLGACFQSGFVLDALEERAFSPDDPPGTFPLSWGGQYSEIPPVIVARMRLVKGDS